MFIFLVVIDSIMHLSQTLRKAGALCTGYDLNVFVVLLIRVCAAIERESDFKS